MSYILHAILGQMIAIKSLIHYLLSGSRQEVEIIHKYDALMDEIAEAIKEVNRKE